MSAFGILSAWDYISDDCNISLYFDQDDKFNMFQFARPCTGDTVSLNGKVVTGSTKASLLKGLADSATRLPIGQCTAIFARMDKFRQAGGKAMSVQEVRDLFAEEDRKEQEAVKASLEEAKDMANAKLREAAASADLDPNVATAMEIVKMKQQAIIKKNTVNGKLRACLVDGGDAGLVLEATGDNDKVKFQKESDGSFIEVSTGDLKACTD